jgi:cold shock CspA family protein
LDIPADSGSRHALTVIGQIKFYDEATAWGVIQGADGGLYAMRGDQLARPRPEVGDRVVFEVQPAAGGPRAIAIRRMRGD